MLRYHQFGNDASIEYGDIRSKDEFEYLLNYSPYHNIKKNEKYPPVLISASENDLRVHPSNAFKMLAKLQEYDKRNTPLLLLYRRNTGHVSGGKDNYIDSIILFFVKFLKEDIESVKDLNK